MISIRLNKNVEDQLKEVAEFEGVSISDYVRKLINEKLEDMYDLKIAEKAHDDYIKSGKKTYSFDEIFKWNIN